MSFEGYAKPIVAIMPRLNENNVQFVMDDYLSYTHGVRFDSPIDIYKCFEKAATRRGYDACIVEEISTDIELIDDGDDPRYKVILSTDDYTGAWYEFNCVIRISKTDKGKYKSEAIYLYVPTEFVSALEDFTIDSIVEKEERGDK